jgi:structure-specific recognition protein 1
MHLCGQGAPKRPATAFVMFSNQHRQEVKEANPQLTMVEIAKKLGEMWRGMEVDVRKEWEDKATQAKDNYLVRVAQHFTFCPP